MRPWAIFLIFALCVLEILWLHAHDYNKECKVTGYRPPTFDDRFRCEQNRGYGSYDCDGDVEIVECKEVP